MLVHCCWLAIPRVCACRTPYPILPIWVQALAEQTLHSLQAAKASPHAATAGKENAEGTAGGPYSHRRVSPGHFLVHPTLRSPLQPPAQQQPSGSATPSSAAARVLAPLGTPHSVSGGSVWGRPYAPPPSPTSGVAATTPQQAAQGQQAASGAAAAATPLSQQGSRVSSALVDNLNLALRALGEPARGPGLDWAIAQADRRLQRVRMHALGHMLCLPCRLPTMAGSQLAGRDFLLWLRFTCPSALRCRRHAGHTPTQRAAHAATPTSRLQPAQPGAADTAADGLAMLHLGTAASTPSPLLLPALGAAAGTTPSGSAFSGSASQRLADLQQRHAQLLADIDAAERRRTEAAAAAAQAESEATAAKARLSAAEQQAQEREAAVAALAAEEAAARERLAGLVDETRQQEQAAQQAQQEAGAAGKQLEAVR